MKSPYDDRLTVQDIASLRNCGEQQVRVLIRRLGIKPMERIGTVCIYSAEDSKRLVDYVSTDGRPKLYGAEDCLFLALGQIGKSFEELGIFDKKPQTRWKYLDRIERAIPGIPRSDGQKFRHCWSEGMSKSVQERRPAWKKDNADIVVAVLVSHLTDHV